jgi:DNA-binding NarL/FixJ family response regulator
LAPTVVVSGVPPEQALRPCFAAGARGFVLREEVADALDQAISVVAGGHTYLDRFSLDWLAADAARQEGTRHLNGTGRSNPLLSRREAEVLALVEQGLGNNEIGEALGLSTNTVKTYIRRAMEKLGAGDRREAAAKAGRHAARVAVTVTANGADSS